MENAKLLILPGWQNSGEGHWQTLFETQFGGKRVEQDDWFYPKRDVWLDRLGAEIDRCSQPVILLAHSLGCILTAHWGSLDTGKVRGAFLVAPPDMSQLDTPPEIMDFAPCPAARLPFPSTLVGTSSDTYASEAALRQMACQWGSEFVLSRCQGHINVSGGQGPWPEGETCFNACLENWRVVLAVCDFWK